MVAVLDATTDITVKDNAFLDVEDGSVGAPSLYVDNNARVTVDGGIADFDDLVIGDGNVGENARFSLLNGASLVATNPIVVGTNGGRGEFTVAAGTVFNSNVSDLLLGANAGDQGDLNVFSGATVTLTGAAQFGALGDTSIGIEDSILNLDSLLLGVDGGAGLGIEGQGSQLNVAANDIVLGVNAGGDGSFSISDATVALPAHLVVGGAGIGRLRTDDGAMLTVNGHLVLGELAGSQGDWDLDVFDFLDVDIVGDLIVGDQGRGEISAEIAGAHIQAANLIVGNQAGIQFFDGGSAFFEEFEDSTLMILGASTIGNQSNGALNTNTGTWSTGGAVTVGHSADGQVNTSDTAVSSDSAVLGMNTTGDGTANLYGGSWNITNGLIAGHQGTASMDMGGGVIVTSAWTTIANVLGSGATVDIYEGSQLSTGQLEVGFGGNGLLDIYDGGSAATTSTRIAFAGQGAVIVDGSSSWLDASSVLSLSPTGVGTLQVFNGAQVTSHTTVVDYGGGSPLSNVHVDGAGSFLQALFLRVGEASVNGGVLIQNGVQADCTDCFIGPLAGFGGVVTVDGAGSQFNSFNRLSIAGAGGGNFNVINGATAATNAIDIGVSGGVGALFVADPGSWLTITTTLDLSPAGEGYASVENGAQAFTDKALIDFAGAVPTFNFHVRDANSFFSANTFRIGSASTNSAAFVDLSGRMDCNVICTVGEAPNMFGSVTVTNMNSTWNVFGDLNVANDEFALNPGGDGIVQIFDHGFVNVGGSTNTYTNPTGFGEIFVDGGYLSTTSLSNYGFLNFIDGVVEVIGGTFDNAGLDFTLDGFDMTDLPLFRLKDGATSNGLTDFVTVGNLRHARLEILGDAQLTSDGGTAGAQFGGEGHVLVNGVNSLWDTGAEPFTAADAGVADVTLTSGGEIHSTGGFIAKQPGSIGGVVVDGIGSLWFSTQNINVGGDGVFLGGTGTLILMDDATVAAPQVTVFEGSSLGGTGTVNGNVHADGTVFPGQSPGLLMVGGDYTQTDTGTLVIELGGLLAGTEFDLLDVTGDAELARILHEQ